MLDFVGRLRLVNTCPLSFARLQLVFIFLRILVEDVLNYDFFLRSRDTGVLVVPEFSTSHERRLLVMVLRVSVKLHM